MKLLFIALFATIVNGRPRNGESSPQWRSYMCNRRKPDLNAELMMHCYAKGNPKPKLEWYKNGHLVQESKRIKIKEASLVIRKIEKQDSGDWECRASNYLGSISHN